MTVASPRIGVVTFPGSLDDLDALRAIATMGGEGGSPCGTRSTTSARCDAVVLPGGFSYGDYLRCGVIAARAPTTRSPRSPAGGGPVLGICNGFQILCESGCCLVLYPQPLAAVRVPRRLSAVSRPATVVTGGSRPGNRSRSRSSTARGCARPARSTLPRIRGRGPRGLPVRDADGHVDDDHNPNGSTNTSPASATGPATSWV